MDRLIELVFANKLDEPTILLFIRQLGVRINSISCIDSYGNVAVACLRNLFSQQLNIMVEDGLKSTVELILSRISDPAMDAVLNSLAESDLPQNVYDSAVHLVEDIQIGDRLTHALDKSINNLLELEFTLSVFRITSLKRTLKERPDIICQLNRILCSDMLYTPLVYIATKEQHKALITYLFTTLSNLDVSLDEVNPNNNDILIELATLLSQVLTRWTVLLDSGDTNAFSRDQAVAILSQLMQSYLMLPLFPETAYLPLASLLFELDQLDLCPIEYPEAMSTFITSFIDCQRNEFKACMIILRRLTVWLLWEGVSLQRSFLDKWIIGFHCEVYKRFFGSDAVDRGINFPGWSELMESQLRFVMQLFSSRVPSSFAVLNTLVFFLIGGGISVSDARISLIMNDFPSALDRVATYYTCMKSSNEDWCYTLRLFQILSLVNRLIQDIASKTLDTSSWCTIWEGLTVIIERLFPHFQDESTQIILRDRANVYNWSTLMKWGSVAGAKLRQCWTKWEDASTEEPLYPHVPYNSDRCRLANYSESTERHSTKHRGLVNIGNTCYANAALQLLYHCPDFRLAVLENHSTAPCSESTDDQGSWNGKDASVSLEVNEQAFVGDQNTGASPFGRSVHNSLLLTHLFTLFHELGTERGPSARNTKDLLILSKPAHFVIGEQQDAGEYLSHLLDRLHEEELQAQRNRTAQNTNRSEPTSLKFFIKSDDGNPPDINQSNQLTCCTQKDSPKNQLNSMIRQLFGGTLVRRTACAECKHVSSTLKENFCCLYLPVTTPDELNDHVTHEELNRVDLTTLIEGHFTQTEHVLTNQECELCGKSTAKTRRLGLGSLASHVLICLNLFKYCRTTHSCVKLMRKISIPEKLAVTLSAAGDMDNYADGKSACGQTPPVRNFDSPPQPNTSSSTNDYENQLAIRESLPEEPDVLSASDSPASHSVTHSVIAAESRPSLSCAYKLQGMILHHGLSFSCGHYTCVARVNNGWISLDDDCVQHTTLEHVYSKPLATPYLLLYTRV